METDQATIWIVLVSINFLDQKAVFAPKMSGVVELRGRLKSCLDISTARVLTSRYLHNSTRQNKCKIMY